MWLGGFWQVWGSRSKRSVAQALMQTTEAGSRWKSQLVCRGIHGASGNDVRLRQPGAPWAPVKPKETSQDYHQPLPKPAAQARQRWRGVFLSGQRSPRTPWPKGLNPSFPRRVWDSHTLPPTRHPGEYLRDGGGNLRSCMFFSPWSFLYKVLKSP